MIILFINIGIAHVLHQTQPDLHHSVPKPECMSNQLGPEHANQQWQLRA